MPPSSNQLYSNVNMRRCKSARYRAYEEEVRIWSYKYGYQLQNARILLQQVYTHDVFHIHRIYYFQKNEILTLKGLPKRNDTSNRIKAIDDVIAQLLGIDDSYFWDGSYSKRVSSHEALGSYVDIIITTMSLDELD